MRTDGSREQQTDFDRDRHMDRQVEERTDRRRYVYTQTGDRLWDP